ncbi:MAG: hypothetical protein GY940_08650, partial [bacterium]|nr:hypothetical protein [bacterium]
MILKMIKVVLIISLITSGWMWGIPSPVSPPEKSDALDRAFRSFWKAGSHRSRNRAIKKILKTKPSFQDVWNRLEKGRSYPDNVKTGRRTAMRLGDNAAKHRYSFYVPPSYDPSRAYPVIFYLHGGVARPPFKPDERWWRGEERAYSENSIAVFPASWNESLWWEHSQVENLSAILERLKQEYHVNENRVYLFGVSDGATGAYYQTIVDATPWAAVLAFIGHMGVLSNPNTGVEGRMFLVNLTNKPFFILNCGHDRLYPLRRVEPYIQLLQSAGGDIRFRPKPFYGHTLRWYEEEKDEINTFLEEKHRKPYPDRLVWETDDTKRSGRVHWLVIDGIGTVRGEPQLKPWNRVEMGNRMPAMGLEFDDNVKDRLQVYRVIDGLIGQAAGLQAKDLLVQANGKALTLKKDFYKIIKSFTFGQTIPLVVQREGTHYNAELELPKARGKRSIKVFPRKGPSGRVELEKKGNRVTARTM